MTNIVVAKTDMYKSKKINSNSETQKYSKATIIIHWLTAGLILILYPLGKYMEGISIESKLNFLKVHVLLGVFVFFLTSVRSILFFRHKRPERLKTGSRFNDVLAEWIHNIFYFLLIAISITGFITIVMGGYLDILFNATESISIQKDSTSLRAHEILSTVMMILLLLHVLGVVKHYILRKENTLNRIS